MEAQWQAVSPLLRLLLVNCVIGIVAGWILLGLLLLSDANGLGSLISEAASPTLPVAMLAAGFAITFGGAAMAAAVMLRGKE